MTQPTIQNPLPKTIALILFTIFGAWLMLRLDASTLVKLDSMTAADYVQKERELHHHSYVFHFIVVLMLGGFYLGVIEVLTYLVALFFPKKRMSDTPPVKS